MNEYLQCYFSFGNEEVKIAEELKYLGSIIHEDNEDKSSKRYVERGRKGNKMLNSIMLSINIISETKELIHYASVQSILL